MQGGSTYAKHCKTMLQESEHCCVLSCLQSVSELSCFRSCTIHFLMLPSCLGEGGKRKRCFPPFVQTYCKHSPCVERFWVGFCNKGLRKTLLYHSESIFFWLRNVSFRLIHYIYADRLYSCQERLLKSATTINIDYRHVTR